MLPSQMQNIGRNKMQKLSFQARRRRIKSLYNKTVSCSRTIVEDRTRIVAPRGEELRMLSTGGNVSAGGDDKAPAAGGAAGSSPAGGVAGDMMLRCPERADREDS